MPLPTTRFLSVSNEPYILEDFGMQVVNLVASADLGEEEAKWLNDQVVLASRPKQPIYGERVQMTAIRGDRNLSRRPHPAYIF
jgi:hypothetical protein